MSTLTSSMHAHVDREIGARYSMLVEGIFFLFAPITYIYLSFIFKVGTFLYLIHCRSL